MESTERKMNEPWANIGITGESQFIQLLFEPHSKSLVAQFYRSIGDHHGVKSFYLRAMGDVRYQRLTEMGDSLSYEDAVLSPNGPFVFVNILQARKERDKHFGYDWCAIRKIRLPEKEVVGEIRDGQLPGAANGQRAWISALQGVSEDGKTVYCVIGTPGTPTENSTKIRYYLAALDFDGKSFKPLTELTHGAL
ncbi:MAG: hypothetical protein HY052_04095 [Proteobacteria bacterium]|nr:hypothetical protein [Pseudomonadota bacterium]